MTSSIRMLTFTGKEEDFLLWWTRFEAYAEVKKFALSLKTGGETGLPITKANKVLDLNTLDGKIKNAKLRRNAVAMATLTMAFTTQGLINMIISSAKDVDYPGGKAYRVIELLMVKYMPKDLVTRVELRKVLNKVSIMKEKENPDVLFEKLKAVENWYNTSTQQISTCKN